MTYIITSEEKREAERLMGSESRVLYYRRLQVVVLRGAGKSVKGISEATAYDPTTVSSLISTFKKDGFPALLSDGRKGGNHRTLSPDEEEELLASYTEQCRKGEVITAKELWKDFEAKTGKTMHQNNFYKLLHRHGWRIISTRPEHPKKASAEEIERSKKLSVKSRKH